MYTDSSDKTVLLFSQVEVRWSVSQSVTCIGFGKLRISEMREIITFKYQEEYIKTINIRNSPYYNNNNKRLPANIRVSCFGQFTKIENFLN